jgi:glycerophosphoryl diester phosphodiesterase
MIRFTALTVVVLSLLFVIALALRGRIAKPVPDRPFLRSDHPWVMAHRGGRGQWPENTLLAFEQSVANGVDVLEMDLHRSRDGIWMVIHDATLERTTNGSGPVHQFTAAELQKLDAGYAWTADNGQSYPFRGRGIRIPTLEQVMQAFPSQRLNLEIKEKEESAPSSLCQLIRTQGAAERVLVASVSAKTLMAFRQACPQVATSAAGAEVRLFFLLSRLRLTALYPARADALQVPEYFGPLHVVTPRFIAAAHRLNLKVHIWTVNQQADMQRLLVWKADGIITDYPKQLLEVIRRPKP